jgi:hypothetical protein
VEVEGSCLRSRVNGAVYGIGLLELVSLATLRDRVLSKQIRQRNVGVMDTGWTYSISHESHL